MHCLFISAGMCESRRLSFSRGYLGGYRSATQGQEHPLTEHAHGPLNVEGLQKAGKMDAEMDLVFPLCSSGQHR